jgi:hypothetical protein
MESKNWKLGLWAVLWIAGVVFLIAGSRALLKVVVADLGPKAAGYYAKQYCSCRFVQLGDPKVCNEKIRIYVPAQVSERKDGEIQFVQALAWGFQAQARVVQEAGVSSCVLELAQGASI